MVTVKLTRTRKMQFRTVHTILGGAFRSSWFWSTLIICEFWWSLNALVRGVLGCWSVTGLYHDAAEVDSCIHCVSWTCMYVLRCRLTNVPIMLFILFTSVKKIMFSPMTVCLFVNKITQTSLIKSLWNFTQWLVKLLLYVYVFCSLCMCVWHSKVHLLTY